MTVFFAKEQKSLAGFTLIELLVAIFIMALLIVASVPQFRQFGKKAQTEATANETKALIEKTRTLAMAPREIDKNIKYYQMKVERNGKWIIEGVKDGNQNVTIEQGKINDKTLISRFYYNIDEDVVGNQIVLGFKTPTGQAIESLNSGKNRLSIQFKYKGTQITSLTTINLISSQIETKNE